MPGGRFGRGLRIHRHSGHVGFDPSVNNILNLWFSQAFWASPIPIHVTFHDSMSLIDAIVSRLPDPPFVSRSSSMHTPSALRNAIAVKKSGCELGVDRSSPCHVGPSPSYPLVWSKQCRRYGSWRDWCPLSAHFGGLQYWWCSVGPRVDLRRCCSRQGLSVRSLVCWWTSHS